MLEVLTVNSVAYSNYGSGIGVYGSGVIGVGVFGRAVVTGVVVVVSEGDAAGEGEITMVVAGEAVICVGGGESVNVTVGNAVAVCVGKFVGKDVGVTRGGKVGKAVGARDVAVGVLIPRRTCGGRSGGWSLE